MAQKRKRTSKNLALISLAVMAAGFVITLLFHAHPVLQVLQGGFEAGLVGGLADWFAVTALFRHPLGIPIPHTALLVKNRKRLIDALVGVLENDWLTKESIKNKLGQVNFVEKLGAVIGKELYSDSMKKWISGELVPFVAGLSAEKPALYIEREIMKRADAAGVKLLLTRAAGFALESGLPRNALDYAVSEAEKWAEKEETRAALGAAAMRLINGVKADGLLKLTLSGLKMLLDENRLGAMLQPVVLDKIRELRSDGSEWRRAVISALEAKAAEIPEDGRLMGDISVWINEAAGNYGLAGKITEILYLLKDRLTAALQSEDAIEREILPRVKAFLGNLLSSPEKTGKIEAWIRRAIYELVDANHSRIGKLVRENLDKLDDKALVTMMENSMGKDLQWIRVNGAVCGFLIGIGLTLVRMAV
ncbi:MAG: DUF445 domain-containing protein [Firmicutes bacterium]|nr:DUF445 domain-containing protein [Bacillota bacterium]